MPLRHNSRSCDSRFQNLAPMVASRPTMPPVPVLGNQNFCPPRTRTPFEGHSTTGHAKFTAPERGLAACCVRRRTVGATVPPRRDHSALRRPGSNPVDAKTAGAISLILIQAITDMEIVKKT
jgi:hypothetical protein